jgi:hypothetical protein
MVGARRTLRRAQRIAAPLKSAGGSTMRMLALAATVSAALVTNARAADFGRPTPDPITACQSALARASRQLGGSVRSQIGRCIGAGVHCLTAGTDVSACCVAATPRCQAQERKLAGAAQRFAENIASGRCARIPLATVLASDGLGFENAAAACQCLSTPVDVVDLRSLGVCLGRLVDAETTRLVAAVEAPRAAEALTCVGLAQHVDVLDESDAGVACDSTHATVTPTPVATPVPKRTHRPRRTPAATATVSSATATVTAGTPVPTPTPTPFCGNGVVEGDEECDGNAYDEDGCSGDVCTCDDFCDDAGGRLACRHNCTIDFSHCTAGGCEF